MNQKIIEIKKIIVFSVGFILIVFLGFAPSSTQKVLAIYWGDLGVKMIDAGVIDKEKIENLYKEKGGFSEKDREMMYGNHNRDIIITSENSAIMLNMLWVFGLANKNSILEDGPMMDPRYGGAENFASTGGWTLSKGSTMDHYNMHKFVTLTREQQTLVEKVAKNVYRPCCQNSTYFPDCNHGMAMLGLLELKASRGASEAEMYDIAQEVNNLWFPKVAISGCSV